jgi:ribosomal protein S18 acetylase RimI-like enzyme
MITVEGLTAANAQHIADLVREYMVMTEVERGNEAVKTQGLPAKLADECRHILEAYAYPNAFFLINDSGRDLGGVGLKVFGGGKSAEVCRLYIRDEARGRGLGGRLMEKCIDYARENGINRLVLDILPSRTRVIAWYKKLGFKRIKPYANLPVPMVYMGLDVSGRKTK